MLAVFTEEHTFMLCRLEQVDLSRRHGVAKVVGTVVSIGGATVITLYKGLPLFHYNLTIKSLLTLSSSSPILNWTLGCVFILGHCLSWSGWMVLQVTYYYFRCMSTYTQDGCKDTIATWRFSALNFMILFF